MIKGTDETDALGFGPGEVNEVNGFCNHSCPTCCEPSDLHPTCFWKGCNHAADVEGWHQNVDGMGFETGLSIKIQVCNEHIYTLIGYKKGEST